MVLCYFLLAAALIFLSFRSFQSGLQYKRFVLSELSKSKEFFPFASIIAPCRGCDPGLQENLSSLFLQDYPEYEVIFVTDDERDASVPVVRSVIEEFGGGRRARLVIAPKAVTASQKVENLREAVLHIDERSRVLAFVDSDARPTRRWLRSLVSYLSEREVGASTGYRWFFGLKPDLASELLSSWNASIASSLGPDRGSNFCWGGAMAIRRDVFEQVGMRDKWAGTLSDDFTVTNTMRAEGFDIAYAPGALTPSFSAHTFCEAIEFTTRQMKITRVYGPRYWAMSLLGSAVFTSVAITTAILLVMAPQDGFVFWAALVALGLVTVFSVGKSIVRLRAVEAALPEYKNYVRGQFKSQCMLWCVTPFIFLINSVAAAFSRRIQWRGNVYELKSPNETVIIASDGLR